MEKRRARGEESVYYNDTLERWQAQLTLPNGKKKTKTAKTQREVKKWLLEQRKAVEDNTYTDTKDVTLEAFLKRYMEDVASHTLAPKSISSSQYIIDSHILPDLGKIRLTQLCPDHLQKVYSDKLNSGLSKRSVLYIHQVLHKAIGQAVKWGLVARNVTDLADHPNIRRKAPETLTVAQARQLLDSLEKDRVSPLYLLAFPPGCGKENCWGCTGDIWIWSMA
jgi:integrase